MTRVYFFYQGESRKNVGVNGAERGEGGVFAVPHCALQPHYGGGSTDARVFVYCSFFFFCFCLLFFRSYTCMYISVRDLQCSLFNKVFLNWIELNYSHHSAVCKLTYYSQQAAVCKRHISSQKWPFWLCSFSVWAEQQAFKSFSDFMSSFLLWQIKRNFLVLNMMKWNFNKYQKYSFDMSISN